MVGTMERKDEGREEAEAQREGGAGLGGAGSLVGA